MIKTNKESNKAFTLIWEKITQEMLTKRHKIGKKINQTMMIGARSRKSSLFVGLNFFLKKNGVRFLSA